ncbi:hypothetical protein BBP40_012612 [Aspergillus hancockii]|nr:hypothetical protein BBP40_012612 [Aspergillus hancockii]
MTLAHASRRCFGVPSVSDQGEEGEKRVAGLLLEWNDGFSLGNLSLSANHHLAASSKSNHAKLSEQLTGIIRELHHHRISTFGVDISPFGITIDRSDGHAWLTGFMNCEVAPDYSTAEANALEQKQIRSVFDQWLSAEAEASDSNPDDDEVRKVYPLLNANDIVFAKFSLALLTLARLASQPHLPMQDELQVCQTGCTTNHALEAVKFVEEFHSTIEASSNPEKRAADDIYEGTPETLNLTPRYVGEKEYNN